MQQFQGNFTPRLAQVVSKKESWEAEESTMAAVF